MKLSRARALSRTCALSPSLSPILFSSRYLKQERVFSSGRHYVAMVKGDHRDKVVHKAMAKWKTDYPYQGTCKYMYISNMCLLTYMCVYTLHYPNYAQCVCVCVCMHVCVCLCVCVCAIMPTLPTLPKDTIPPMSSIIEHVPLRRCFCLHASTASSHGEATLDKYRKKR